MLSHSHSPLFVYSKNMTFTVSYWVHDMESVKKKAITVGIIFTVNILCVIIFGVLLGWI